jgi:hypothetical protein
MPYRLSPLLLAVVCLLGAAPASKPAAKPASKAAPKPAAKPAAPDVIAHPIAIFLRKLSDDGSQRVQFRAAAHDKHFFFEETAGVTVYQFDGVEYKKVEFLRGETLAKAMKKYQ